MSGGGSGKRRREQSSSSSSLLVVDRKSSNVKAIDAADRLNRRLLKYGSCRSISGYVNITPNVWACV